MQARILKVHIERFRCFRQLDFCPGKINVLVAPNNEGKSALLQAAQLALSSTIQYVPNLITENDFYEKQYLPAGSSLDGATEKDTDQEGANPDVDIHAEEESDPEIVIELTIGPLATSEDKAPFSRYLEAWSEGEQRIIPLEEDESAIDRYPNCVRITFVAWYDPEEDDFFWRVVFPFPNDGTPLRDKNRVKQEALRTLGFLMYRDYRPTNQPITLAPRQLFHKLLTAYSARPTTYERLLRSLEGTGDALHEDPQFSEVVQDFQAEMERFLPLRPNDSDLHFDVTDLTRRGVREATQAFVKNEQGFGSLPLEMYGAGTRSMATLAILTLFARKREHAILAVEEPETFLYPSSQRAVIREIRTVATQLFLTTHSPYVLDLFEPDEIRVLSVSDDGTGTLRTPTVAGVKEHSRYYRVLRAGLSEAILSPRAMLVEGESDAPIIRGFGELSLRLPDPEVQCDLDRNGIAVVECGGVGELCCMASFLSSVGVKCIIVHDTISDPAERGNIDDAPGDKYDIGYKGIESLLAAELPEDLMRDIVRWAQKQPGLKKTPVLDADIADIAELRDATVEFLARNKRTPSLYSRLLEVANARTFCPPTVMALFRAVNSSSALGLTTESPCESEEGMEAVGDETD